LATLDGERFGYLMHPRRRPVWLTKEPPVIY
jgi:hypothetical protein